MSPSQQKSIFYWGSPSSPFVREQVEVSKSLGFNVSWFFHKPFQFTGVTSYSLPTPISRSNFIRAFYEPLYVSYIVGKIKPNLIHIFYASKGASFIPLSRYHPLLVSVMGSDIAPNIGYRWPYRKSIRGLLQAADEILIKSSFMETRLIAMGVSREKIVHLPWGIDLDVFDGHQDTQKLSDALGISTKGMIFFDPRNGRRLYNKHISLQAFAIFLRETQRKNDLLILSEQSGSPAYLKELRQFTKYANIESNVRFAGTIPFDLIPSYYALADIVISVPSSDGVPQSLYEAMASGCALIITDLPEYDDLTNKGMVAEKVPVGDAFSLALAMINLANNQKFQTHAEIINRNTARRFFDLKKNKEKLAMLYQQI